MSELRLEDYDLLLIDLDGVVWLRNEPIAGAVETLNRIHDGEKIEIRFVTNNSTRHRKEVAETLRRIGIRWAEQYHVITSASTLADLSSVIGIERCFIVGEQGLLMELEEEGVDIGGKGDVCVGMDRNFNYQKLTTALRNILAGGLFLATNEDRTFPTPDGPIPGAGSMVSAISGACGRPPDIVIGKPNPIMFLRISIQTGAKRPLVIGDRIETDVLGALRAGMDSALVLTGAAKDLREVKPRPKYVLRSLRDLLKSGE